LNFPNYLTKTGKMRVSHSVYKIIFLLCLLFPLKIFATDYFVSSTGNDANPGTSIATAWATISKVNGTIFLPGDALYFEGGKTFSGSINLLSSDANDPDNPFVISSYGAGMATINAGTSNGFYAYNTQGFSISKLIIDGNNRSTNTGAGILIFSDLPGNIKFSNISISDMEIKNFGGEGVKIYTTQGLTGFQNVMLNNLSVHDVTKNGIVVFGFIAQTLKGWQHANVIVSHCEVYNIPGSFVSVQYEGSGIVLEGVDRGIIQNCSSHDNGNNNAFCGGPVGIWALESNEITIQYCESYRNHSGSGCDGGGFDLDGGVTNSFLQYNYSHENDGAGFLLGQYANARPWSNNTMRYNISQNDGITNEGSIDLFKGPGTTMDGCNIYNNTIYISPQPANIEESAVYFKNWMTGINNVSFYNNIFITSGNVPLMNIPTGFSPFFAGNIYWTTGGLFSIKYNCILYASLASWRSATLNEIVNGTNTGFSADPLLTNTGAGGTIGYGNSLSNLNAYKLNSILSPAYVSALDLNSLLAINVGFTDFWNTSLPGGNANDIGANQFVSILPTQLMNFHGSCSGNGQSIYWTTSEEENIKSFELLQSGDGQLFKSLTEINPRGSNSNYSYVNNSELPGDNYYQLKKTDLDGYVSYSSILNVSCSEVGNKITAGPNPFNQFVNVSIESTSASPVTITLFDLMGKMQTHLDVQLLKGNNTFQLDRMEKLPADTYFLHIVHPDKSEYVKLIKTAN